MTGRYAAAKAASETFIGYGDNISLGMQIDGIGGCDGTKVRLRSTFALLLANAARSVPWSRTRFTSILHEKAALLDPRGATPLLRLIPVATRRLSLWFAARLYTHTH
jgi:hypothetical protein